MESTDDPAGPTPKQVLVWNERAKLTATYANGIAIAVFAVGGLAPVVSLIAAGSTPGSHHAVYGLAGICWIVSGILHWSARRSLGGLIA